MMDKMAHGGKMKQGYNDRMDDSLGNRTGKSSSKEQDYKDRRDESKAMNKAEGKRAYQSVGTMDKMASGGLMYIDTEYDLESAEKRVEKLKKSGKYRRVQKRKNVYPTHTPTGKRSKRGSSGTFYRIFAQPKKMADGGRVNEHLDKADSHLREAGSKLWENKNPKSDEYKKAYDDFQDKLTDIYTPREWNELDYAKGGGIDDYVAITLVPKKTAYKGGKGEVYKNMQTFYDTINSNEDKYPFIHSLQITDSRKANPEDISEIRVYMLGEKSGFDDVEKKGLYDLFGLKKSKEEVIQQLDKMADGGKTDDWIQGVEAEMEKKGTVGAFTKQAKRAGMTVKEFTKEVLDNPDKYSKRTRERAQFAKNVSKYESGGKTLDAHDVAEKFMDYKYPNHDWWDGENYKDELAEGRYLGAVQMVELLDGDGEDIELTSNLDGLDRDVINEIRRGERYESGGLFDSKGRKYNKKKGSFLTSEWFTGDLDFLNY